MRKVFRPLILLLVLLLVGCQSIQKDGPPRFPRNVDRIPDAVPKVEKHSARGNKPYSVFGKKYHPLPSSKNYKESGLASWYGTKFHGNATSSGEPYDLYAMTAAHRTLPLPTYARITNTQNGKSVIVKINDRGPFHSNRLIDLSYAAARKLGIYGHGTGHVTVEAIDPRHLKASSTAPTVAPKSKPSNPHPSTHAAHK